MNTFQANTQVANIHTTENVCGKIWNEQQFQFYNAENGFFGSTNGKKSFIFLLALFSLIMSVNLLMCFFTLSFHHRVNPHSNLEIWCKGYDAITTIIRSILFVLFCCIRSYISLFFSFWNKTTIKVNANELQTWILFEHCEKDFQEQIRL